MKKKVDEESSSEDETHNKLLLEATDHQFFNNSLFNKNQEKSQDTVVKKPVSSNNNSASCSVKDNHDETFEKHGLSQSCKDFIAKKLFETLEKDLTFSKKKSPITECQNKEETGIKLFCKSSTSLSENLLETDEHEVNKSKRKANDTSFDEKDIVSKCKTVAVNPDDILSQKDTNLWLNKKVGKEYKYKKSKKGILTEIT